MSYSKVKSECGSGGKLGHSNMCHWGRTDVTKDIARTVRRKNDKAEVEEQMADLAAEQEEHEGD